MNRSHVESDLTLKVICDARDGVDIGEIEVGVWVLGGEVLIGEVEEFVG
jgi:hypothetical protein